MRYDFQCEKCGEIWEETHGIQFRDTPTALPCPKCNKLGFVKRIIGKLFISYDGNKTVLQRAGHEWNDVLKRVKKGSGKGCTIETR